MIQREKRIKELEESYGDDLVTTLKETAYINFIKDKENGLYNILKMSILKLNANSNDFEIFCTEWDKLGFIEEFCTKYGFNLISVNSNTETNLYIDNIKTMEDIKRLIKCFYWELQQIEHYSKSADELWNENNLWIDFKRSRTK